MGGSRGWRVEFSQPFKNKQCFKSGEGRKFFAGKVVALTKVQSQEQLGMLGIGPQGMITEARVALCWLGAWGSRQKVEQGVVLQGKAVSADGISMCILPNAGQGGGWSPSDVYVSMRLPNVSCGLRGSGRSPAHMGQGVEGV